MRRVGLFILVVLLLVTTTVYAASFHIYQLTDNDVQDLLPAVFDNTIAWSGHDGSDYEILFWNGIFENGSPSIEQVTNNDYDDSNPSLYDGKIAWGGHGIHYWDGSRDGNGAATNIQQLSSRATPDDRPSLWDGTVAWAEINVTGDIEIFFWDGASAVNVSNQDAPDMYPSLYDGTIAWSSDSAVHYWDGIDTAEVTDNGGCPSLYKSKIAWSAFDGTDYEIYYWDGNTIMQVSDNSSVLNIFPPSLYDGTIVWSAYDGTDYEIFYWDGGTITQVTNNQTDDRSPSIYGRIIAWYGSDGNDNEIYYAVQKPVAIIVVDSIQPFDDLEMPFGSIVEGDFSEAILTIANDGYEQLTVSNITMSDALNYFLTGDTSATIAPGVNHTLTVTFSPQSAGVYDATVTIESNDPDKPTVVIALTGEALMDTDGDGIRDDVDNDNDDDGGGGCFIGTSFTDLGW